MKLIVILSLLFISGVSPVITKIEHKEIIGIRDPRICIKNEQILTKKEGSNQDLFLIMENGRMGFVDKSGKVVINPIFRSASEFSEGLAAARLDGNFGYIDNTGNFQIPPTFDFATPFSEGLAIVFTNGIPGYINKDGKQTFKTKFATLEPFKNGKAKIKTFTNKYGFIDRQGNLIIDTVFSSINPFIHGFAVVEGLNHNPYPEEKEIKSLYEIGVIDSIGNLIIPFAKYKEIADYENGYFMVSTEVELWNDKESKTKTGFVDNNGQLVFIRDLYGIGSITGNINCGLAKMKLYKDWENPKKRYAFDNTYRGFINLEGEIVISDTAYDHAYDFAENRTFIGKAGSYFMINTNGDKISNDEYSEILGNGFKNGIAIVKKVDQYGLIDTIGNFIVNPQFKGIDRTGIIDDYFFFFERDPNGKSDYDRIYGIAKTDGTILVKPFIQEFDRNGFINGLLKCIVNDKLAYIDMAGVVIWQQQEPGPIQPENLNVDFMNRGYFYAYSIPNDHDIGGFGSSNNSSKEISKKDNFPLNTLSLIVLPDMPDTIANMYNGITVRVANTSKKNSEFNAQDSRLYMKVQALNPAGEWKDIEYLPSSWCGNSYHTLMLEPNQFWSFVTPAYEGVFKTKLRVELKYIDPKDHSKKRRRKEITIYSNEYEGSINPGQFWRKLEYFPNGIMDPYNE